MKIKKEEITIVNSVPKKRGRPTKVKTLDDAQNETIPKKSKKASETKEKKLTGMEALQTKMMSLSSNSTVPMNILSLSKKDILEIFSKQLPTREEALRLVKLYYQIQSIRIISSAQVRAAEKASESSYLLSFFKYEYETIEAQIVKVLDAYTDQVPIAWCLKQITGIGPVISAGLVSGFDIRRAYTAGSFWRYCGLDPTVPVRKKGEKLKYNKDLKTLVIFKLGESFVYQQNNPNDIYGHIFAEWKEEYTQRNARGEYVNRAAVLLKEKVYDKTKPAYIAYSEGKLPDGQIHNMARRKPLMLLISHMFDLEYQLHWHKPSPVPYVIAYKDHVHQIENPLIKIWVERFGPIPMDGVEQEMFGKYDYTPTFSMD